MPHGTFSEAIFISSPRLRTSLIASSKLSAPTEASAAYSPSESPAAAAQVSGLPSLVSSAVLTASPASTSAGCCTLVSTSAVSGPSKIVFESAKPSSSSARSKSARTEGNAPARSLPMPTACAPCPGKTRTVSFIFGLPLQHGRRPRQPRAESDQDHVLSLGQAAGAAGFVQRHGDRCGGGVAVFVQVHHEQIHRNFQAFDCRFDDPNVGLMRNDRADVLNREFVELHHVA